MKYSLNRYSLRNDQQTDIVEKLYLIETVLTRIGTGTNVSESLGLHISVNQKSTGTLRISELSSCICSIKTKTKMLANTVEKIYTYEQFNQILFLCKNIYIVSATKETLSSINNLVASMLQRIRIIEDVKSKLTPGFYLFAMTYFEDTFLLKSILTADSSESFTALDMLQQKSETTKDFFDMVNTTEKIKSNISLSINKAEDLYTNDQISARSELSKDIRLNIEAKELISAEISTVILYKIVAELDIDLKVGDELILDSNKFIFLQNNKNVIHSHNGGWINLGRETIRINIDGGGTVNGELLYQERFL